MILTILTRSWKVLSFIRLSDFCVSPSSKSLDRMMPRVHGEGCAPISVYRGETAAFHDCYDSKFRQFRRKVIYCCRSSDWATFVWPRATEYSNTSYHPLVLKRMLQFLCLVEKRRRFTIAMIRNLTILTPGHLLLSFVGLGDFCVAPSYGILEHIILYVVVEAYAPALVSRGDTVAFHDCYDSKF